MDVNLKDGKWILSMPIADNYTVREASVIMRSGVAWVASREELSGPASTHTRPVDHDALVRYVLVRERKRKRVKARTDLERMLKQHLVEGG